MISRPDPKYSQRRKRRLYHTVNKFGIYKDKMALTRTSESVPFTGGRLLLGTWQGIFLWEHRRGRPTRTVIVTVLG